MQQIKKTHLYLGNQCGLRRSAEKSQETMKRNSYVPMKLTPKIDFVRIRDSFVIDVIPS